VSNDPSHGITRRTLLGAASTAAGLSLLAGSMQKALAAPERTLRSLDQIEHVIILMQENRSFDHYFGTLKGVRGFDDPDAVTLATGRSVFHQPDPQNPDGYLLPFHNDTKTTSAAIAYGTSHSWQSQHRSWNDGGMDNWVPTHRAADGPVKGPFTMGYYTRDDLPFHYALADAFTVCDNYFCSVFGPTHPNRVMAISGTIDPDGRLGGPVVDNSSTTFRWTTYPERLQAAGVSWRYCTAYPPDTDLGWFKAFQDAKPGDALYENAMVPFSPSQVAEWSVGMSCRRLPGWTRSTFRRSTACPRRPKGLGTSLRPVLSTCTRSSTHWARGPMCGPRPSSSSTTTRTTAASIMCRRRPRQRERLESGSPPLRCQAARRVLQARSGWASECPYW